SSLLLRFLSDTSPPPTSTLFPYTTLFRSYSSNRRVANSLSVPLAFSIEKVTRPTLPYGSRLRRGATSTVCEVCPPPPHAMAATRDRKSTRLNSSHGSISYAVFCLKKKNRS